MPRVGRHGITRMKLGTKIQYIKDIDLGVSENVVYPFLPNGFADHYPY